MSTVYLVDYENVNEHGIYGMRMLPAEDTVYILYTENADKVSLDCFDMVKANYRVIKVPVGNQSLDMHLSTFLGYLIGSEKDTETKYVVISKDMDYQGIIDFWADRCDTPDKVDQQTYIGDTDTFCDPVPQPPESRKIVSPAARRNVIRECIKQVFANEAEKDEWGCLRIQFSLLCERLNTVSAYQREKKSCHKKPQQFLSEDFPDLIRIYHVNQTAYAYAVKPLADMIDALQAASDRITADEAAVAPAGSEEAVPESNEERAVEAAEPFDGSPVLSAESVDEEPRADNDHPTEVSQPEEPDLPLPETPKEEPLPEHEPVENSSQGLSPQPYADAEKTLVEGGIDPVVAVMIAPIVADLELVDSPKIYLYNHIRQRLGAKQGARCYHQVKALLNL